MTDKINKSRVNLKKRYQTECLDKLKTFSQKINNI